MRKNETEQLPWSNAFKNLEKLNLRSDDINIIATIIKSAYIKAGIDYGWIGTRKRDLVETNAIITTVLLENFRITLQSIGKIFNKHHGTIIHYRGLYEEQLCMYDDSKALHSELSAICFASKHNFSIEIAKALSSNEIPELKRTIISLRESNSKLFRQILMIKRALDVSDANILEPNNV